MRTQETFIRMGPFHKDILLPLVSDWSELFATHTTDKANAPAPHTFKIPGEKYPCEIGPWMRTEYATGRQTINGYESPTYAHGPSVYVRLHDDIAQQAFASTIGIDDRLYFQLIQWNPEEAVIILNHNKILGSRWLAVINPQTIPADVQLQPAEQEA